MLDVNEAHKILGINKGASKNEIERRYTIILKKHRMMTAEGRTDEETEDIDQITMAYNLLMGYVEPPTEEELKAPNPLIQKMGIDEKKARNFFYYYKVHIIIGIIALIVIAFTVKGCITRVDPDFNMAFVGNLGYSNTDILKDAIKTNIPSIKEPGFDGAYIVTSPTEGQQETGSQTDGQQTTMPQSDGQQEYAMQMKAMVLFSAADIDLFILDKANYERYAAQGAFISLDEISGKLGIDSEKSKSFMVENNEDKTSHVYGIDVTNSKVLKDSQILGNELIAAIPVRSKQSDKAIEVLKLLLK